jgi:LysR family transcriptional regulator of beta-lactamase
MDRPQLPLNALRAFEAAARHLSLTRAGLELHVSQAAVSHQVNGLEQRLGVPLFRRLPRGLALTDEGAALVPVLAESFDRISAVLDRYAAGGCAKCSLWAWSAPSPRAGCCHVCPASPTPIPLSICACSPTTTASTWREMGSTMPYASATAPGTARDADRLMTAPLTPMCAPAVAQRLEQPGDLAGEMLLRSYRPDEWPRWFEAAQAPCPPLHGPMFDSSVTTAAAAIAGTGVALLPARMFEDALDQGGWCAPLPRTWRPAPIG